MPGPGASYRTPNPSLPSSQIEAKRASRLTLPGTARSRWDSTSITSTTTRKASGTANCIPGPIIGSRCGCGRRAWPATGRARFVFRNCDTYAAASQKEPWTVTNRWQKFHYDFVAPEYPTEHHSHIEHALEFTGPGTVWIDNFVLYRNDAKHEHRPFTPHEISFDELMSAMPQTGRKAALRFYGTIFHPSSIEAMFTDYGNSSWEVAWNCHVGNAPATTIAQCMYWAYKTGKRPATRVVPYLTCNEEYTEDEWLGAGRVPGRPVRSGC